MTQIQKATESDLDNIYKLYLSLLESYPEAFVESYESASKKDIIDWKEDFTDNHILTYVAEEDGKLIGMSALEYHDKGTNIPYITKMGVLPQHKGTGIGRELMDMSVKGARELGAKELRLFVMANMDKTINFYKKTGFTTIESLKNDIEDYTGEMRDVDVMQKIL